MVSVRVRLGTIKLVISPVVVGLSVEGRWPS